MPEVPTRRTQSTDNSPGGDASSHSSENSCVTPGPTNALGEPNPPAWPLTLSSIANSTYILCSTEWLVASAVSLKG